VTNRLQKARARRKPLLRACMYSFFLAKRVYDRHLTARMQTLEQQLQGAQDALQKKDLEVQVCKVEFDARNAEERLRFASEIKARNEELLALRVDRDDCVRQWAAEKSSMQEEIKVRRVH
jgi:hypothetical protein